MTTVAVRGRIAHCLREPLTADDVEYFDDGALVIVDGCIDACGPAEQVLPTESSFAIADYRGQLVIPGLVDCHIHYPQTDIIASYGEQLLSWLETYTFPEEARFADLAHARDTADFFVRELLGNGTTTALVFATVHPGSVDAIFEAAATYNMRVAAGKVLMDRHCPENLRDTAESGYADSRTLLERWHGNGRAIYAITPRFAVTSTPEQLDAAARLHNEFPDTLVHTHLAENDDEIDWISKLFPESRSYLDVYVRHGLVTANSVFAHGIHLDDEDRRVMSDAGGAIAFCPTSNLFLGSGLFDWRASRDAGIDVGMGTDVGGGTSFSLAADPRRGLQGAADEAPEARQPECLVSGDTGRRESTIDGRQDRQFRSRQGSGFHRAGPASNTPDRATPPARAIARRRVVRAVDARRRPLGRSYVRSGREVSPLIGPDPIRVLCRHVVNRS